MQTVQLDKPPAIGTYNRVVRRLDRDARWATQQKFSSYDTALTGKAVKHPDGEVAVTLFFPVDKDLAATRACMIGWTDVTEEWVAGLPLTVEGIQGMEWLDLRKAAVKHGLSAKGGRPEVEARMIEALVPTEE